MDQSKNPEEYLQQLNAKTTFTKSEQLIDPCEFYL